jgi:hypothetical protein
VTYLAGSRLSFLQDLIEALLEEILEPFSMFIRGVTQRPPAKGISGKVESALEVVI